MKRLLILGVMVVLMLGSCTRDPEIWGTNRSFDIIPVLEGEWTGESNFAPTQATYQVVAKGGSGWKLEVVDATGLNEFVVTPDYPNMRFKVEAPKGNNGETTKRIELKITYNNDIWRNIVFRQIPDFFSVGLGEAQSDGIMAYTIDKDGLATYEGNIFSPGGKEIVISFQGSDDDGVDKDTFIPNLSDDSTKLSFTSTLTLDKIMNLTAKYKINQLGETDPRKIHYIYVRQNGKEAPAGSIVENSAPGGYFFRMKYNGIDLAGEDLLDLAGKTWTQVYYPDGGAPGKINNWASTYSSTNEPCPNGWRAMTASDGKRLSGGNIDIRFGDDKPADAPPAITAPSNAAYASINTGMMANFIGNTYSRRWLVSTTSSTVDIFTRPTGINQWFILLNTAGVMNSGSGQGCRMQVLNNYNQMAIETVGQGQASIITGGSQRYTYRCVRDTPAE